MSIAPERQLELSRQDEIVFPEGDLYSNEPPLETYLHLQQIIVLLTCLEWWWGEGGSSPRSDYFAAGNLTIYYSPQQSRSEDFRGPDFFVVLGTKPYPRKSWVVWEEGGKYPNLIIELLSSSTATIDRGLKKQIYQDIFRTPEYFWFDPDSLEFKGFELLRGEYQELQPKQQGWLWSHQLQLFLGVEANQLRFFTPSGQLVPTPAEAAKAARQQVEVERQQNEKLAAKLRDLGVDPDQL